jgi:hypothetical protein
MRPSLGELDAAAFSYQWTHPDPRLDRLQQEVAALVEAGERSNTPADETFYAIKALAEETAGLVLTAAGRARPPFARKETPHLTESWFC